MAPCPTCKPTEARQQAAAQESKSAQGGEPRGSSSWALGNVPEFDLENVDWDALEKLAVEVQQLLFPFSKHTNEDRGRTLLAFADRNRNGSDL